MERKNYQNEYRSSLRDRILQTAQQKFRECGVKAVKMDDIAHQLSISKRTLYELFNNKEELLYECVRDYHETSARKLDKEIMGGKSVIDILFDIYLLQVEEISHTKPIFYEELVKYPKVLECLTEHFRERKAKSIEFLQQGVREGYFCDDINYDIVSQIIIALLEYVMKSKMYNDHPLHEIFMNMQLLIIRGICTEKGYNTFKEKLSRL